MIPEDGERQAAVARLAAEQYALLSQQGLLESRLAALRQEAALQGSFMASLPEELFPLQDGETAAGASQQALAEGRAVALTELELAVWARQLHRLSAAVEAEAARSGMTLRRRPLFGTLPAGMVNARAVAAPDGSRFSLVLLNEGLFGFAYLLTKAVTRCMPLRAPERAGATTFGITEEEWRAELAAHPEIRKRFLEALTATLIAGDPHRAERYLPNARWVQPIGTLVRCMEMFIVGHEYAHCALDHIESEPHPARDGEVPESWGQEFDADANGLRLMIGASLHQDRISPALAFWGADLFFTCTDALLRGKAVLSGQTYDPDAASETHPPIALRRRMIRRALAAFLSEESVTDALHLVDGAAGITEELWRTAEPALGAIREGGARMHPAWGV